jgi:hypothetical protein
MTDPDRILSRIGRELGGDGVLDALGRLAPRDLHSLLLHLAAKESARKTPLDLLAQYERGGAFALGFVDPRLALRFADAAFTAAQAFEALELSPVCPLGTVRAISGIHQNNVLSASRGAELLADPTPLLALECARRRRRPADRTGTIRLCTSHRMMRMQPAPAGLLPHFRLFAMVTAAQKAPPPGSASEVAVELDLLREHLAVYLDLFAALERPPHGFRFADVTVSVAHTGAIEARLAAAGLRADEIRRSVRTEVWNDPDALLAARGLSPVRGRAGEIRPALQALPPALAATLEQIDARVLAPLAAAFPAARLQLDLSRLEGLGYYAGPCVRITARDTTGLMLPLVDGGLTRWTQQLLGDRRERFLITGIGSDLACARYRTTADKAPDREAPPPPPER